MIFVDDVFNAWMKMKNYTIEGNKILENKKHIGDLVFCKYYENQKLKIVIKLIKE